MRNAGLIEAQAGIKIAWRNINNLRYADDTTLMVESEEELKSLFMKAKEESEKVGLKLNIPKRSWHPVPSVKFSSVQFNSVTQSCLTPCDSMDCSIPCPSLSSGVCTNSDAFNQWLYPTISFSVAPFSFCPQPSLALGFFPVIRLFTSGGQSVGVSASGSVLPMNIQN